MILHYFFLAQMSSFLVFVARAEEEHIGYLDEQDPDLGLHYTLEPNSREWDVFLYNCRQFGCAKALSLCDWWRTGTNLTMDAADQLCYLIHRTDRPSEQEAKSIVKSK